MVLLACVTVYTTKNYIKVYKFTNNYMLLYFTNCLDNVSDLWKIAFSCRVLVAVYGDQLTELAPC